MKRFIAFLSCLLYLVACTPDQPENQPQDPGGTESPEAIDYGDGSKERPFVIDNTARLEEFMKIYRDSEQPAVKD